MECADLNKDGLLDYLEFTERFHQPAKSIGFHLCVLIVHLGDLLPSEPRLTAFKQVCCQCYNNTFITHLYSAHSLNVYLVVYEPVTFVRSVQFQN